MLNEKLIAVVGPTASGKTARGVSLARMLDGEIISGDSRQIYRGMDIGTGKDLIEYGDIPYHLIDIAAAGYRYNLFEYVRDARKAIEDIRSRGRRPIVVGGTGMYVETLLKGLNLPEVPENTELRNELSSKSLDELTDILASKKTLHNTTDVDTVKRAVRAIEIATYYEAHPDQAPTPESAKALDALIICVDIPREARRERISRRLRQRVKDGMIEEVKGLLDSGLTPESLIYYGLEYKFVTEYLMGKYTFDETMNLLEIAIHQFAKRQETWFRGMERRGFTLHRLPYDLPENTFNKKVLELLEAPR